MRKKTFTRQLLRHANVLFVRPIWTIVYCDGQWHVCFKDMVDHVQFADDIPKDLPGLFPTTCNRVVQLSGSSSRSGLSFSGHTRYSLSSAKNCEDHSPSSQNLFPIGKLSAPHYTTTFNNPRDTLGLRTSV